MKKKWMAWLLAGGMVMSAACAVSAAEAATETEAAATEAVETTETEEAAETEAATEAVETTETEASEQGAQGAYPCYEEQVLYEKDGISLTVYEITKGTDVYRYLFSIEVKDEKNRELAVLEINKMVNGEEIGLPFEEATSEGLEQKWNETKESYAEVFDDEERANEMTASFMGVPHDMDGKKTIRVSMDATSIRLDAGVARDDVISSMGASFVIYDPKTFEVIDVTDMLEISLPVQETYAEAFAQMLEEKAKMPENESGITGTDKITVTGIREMDEEDYEVYVEKELALSDAGNYFSPQNRMYQGIEFGSIFFDEPIVFTEGTAVWEDNYYSNTDPDITVSGAYPLYKTQTPEESGLTWKVTVSEANSEFVQIDVKEETGADFLLFYVMTDESTGYEKPGWCFVSGGEAVIYVSRMAEHITAEGVKLNPVSVFNFTGKTESLSYTVEAGEWEDDYGSYELEDMILFEEPQTGIGLVTTVEKETGNRRTTAYTILDSNMLEITRHAYTAMYATLEEVPECEVESVSIVAPETVFYYQGDISTTKEMKQIYEEQAPQEETIEAAAAVDGEGSADAAAQPEEGVEAAQPEEGSEDAAAQPEEDSTEASPAEELQIDASVIQSVQEKLNAEGFDCGTADGIAGQKTYAAIESYQESHGMTVTGTIDAELLKEMGIN